MAEAPSVPIKLPTALPAPVAACRLATASCAAASSSAMAKLFILYSSLSEDFHAHSIVSA